MKVISSAQFHFWLLFFCSVLAQQSAATNAFLGELINEEVLREANMPAEDGEELRLLMAQVDEASAPLLAKRLSALSPCRYEAPPAMVHPLFQKHTLDAQSDQVDEGESKESKPEKRGFSLNFKRSFKGIMRTFSSKKKEEKEKTISVYKLIKEVMAIKKNKSIEPKMVDELREAMATVARTSGNENVPKIEGKSDWQLLKMGAKLMLRMTARGESPEDTKLMLQIWLSVEEKLDAMLYGQTKRRNKRSGIEVAASIAACVVLFVCLVILCSKNPGICACLTILFLCCGD